MRKKAGLAVVLVSLLVALPTRPDAIGDGNICYEKFATADYKGAIRYCTSAIDSGELQDPDLIAALINRGVAHKSIGDYESAIADYTRALRIAPNDALLYQNRANALHEMGDDDAALEDIQKSIDLDPKSAGAWYVRGAIAEARSNAGNARKYYMTALSLDPQNKVYREKILGNGSR